MKFSQRIGLEPIRDNLQIQSMDPTLRSGLWTVIEDVVLGPAYRAWAHYRMSTRTFGPYQQFLLRMWADLLEKPREDFSKLFKPIKQELERQYFHQWEWWQVYDFLELVLVSDIPIEKDRFREAINEVLEREMAAYRLIDEQVVRIIEDEELAAVGDAAGHPRVQSYISAAMSHLTDRERPEYSEAVAQAVTAVEVILAALPDEEDILTERLGLAPVMAAHIEGLSDLRHMEAPRFEDAKFVLVTCTAAVSQLVVKAQRAGISL